LEDTAQGRAVSQLLGKLHEKAGQYKRAKQPIGPALFPAVGCHRHEVFILKPVDGQIPNLFQSILAHDFIPQ